MKKVYFDGKEKKRKINQKGYVIKLISEKE